MSTNTPETERATVPSTETRALEPNEKVILSLDPMARPNPELAEICESLGPIVGEVDVADMRFALVDMRQKSEGSGVEFALVDKPQKHPAGHIEGILVLPKDQDVEIGRNHNTKYLKYTTNVSRKHLKIRYQDDGIVVENLEPKNRTVVTGRITEPASAYQQLDREVSGERETKQFHCLIGGSSLAKERGKANQDALVYFSSIGLGAAMDGVGGQSGGELASGITREVIEKRAGEIRGPLSLEEACDLLLSTLNEANSLVLNDARELNLRAQTTATLGLQCIGPDGPEFVVGSVGDSRAYRLRSGDLQQLTLDDNLVSQGASSREEAKALQHKMNEVTDPTSQLSETEKALYNQRNIITRVVGSKSDIDSSALQRATLKEGDVILLCSDGITDNLTDSEIRAILQANMTPQDLADTLTLAAQRRSREGTARTKADDMTAIVMQFGSAR